jgi:OOP family OmpA-OmpF porin
MTTQSHSRAGTGRKLTLIALAVVSSAPVLAQEILGPYIGGNIGRTTAHFDTPANLGNFVGSGFTVNSATSDNRDTGYKLYGGYRFHRNFAVEGGYFDLGNTQYTYNTTPAGSLSGDLRVKGLNLDLVGILPVTERFSVFGRVGAAYAQSRTSFGRTGAVPLANGRTDKSTNVKFGAGIDYAFSDRLSVRGEIERYRINDSVRSRGYIDMASVGLVYTFGAKPQAVTRTYTPAPVVAAPAPAPAPAPVYTPPPPPPAPAPVYTAPPAPMPAPAPVYTPPARPAKQGRY